MNREVFESKLAESGLDAVMVFSAENVFYLSGSPTVLGMKDFQQTRPNSPRMLIVVRPRDDEPTLISPNIDLGVNKDGAWAKDVRGYAEYSMPPIEMAAHVVKDRGMGDKRLGLEMAAMGVPQYQLLLELLPEATFEDCGSLMTEVRSIKTPEEVAIMRQGVDVMDDAYLEIFTSARVGDSEMELDRKMSLDLASRGFERVGGWLYIGDDAAVIHRPPSEEIKLKPGDIVRTDYVGYFKNYCANLSRHAVVGEPSTEQRRVYQDLREVEGGTAASAIPGAKASDVYNYCHNAILGRGYAHPISLIGHNTGLNVHDLPMFVASDHMRLETNMVFCLEPVIGPYWHIQDQYLLTEDGGQLLSDKFDTTEIFVID
jgi:Xaa-Pro aminopeptidase